MRTTTYAVTIGQKRQTHQLKRKRKPRVLSTLPNTASVDNVHHLARQLRISALVLRPNTNNTDEQTANTSVHTRHHRLTVYRKIMAVEQLLSPSSKTDCSLFMHIVHMSMWAISMSIPKTGIPSIRTCSCSETPRACNITITKTCSPYRDCALLSNLPRSVCLHKKRATHTCQTSTAMCVP